MNVGLTELVPVEVRDLLASGKVLLVDVREPVEFASERIHGAFLYPMSTFDATQLPTDGSRRVVFYCGSGKRSLNAARLRLATGQPASHMVGGIGAWKDAGLPLIRIDPASGRILDTGRA